MDWWYLGLGIIAYVAYVIVRAPLRHIPGPFLSRISTYPESQAFRRGGRSFWVDSLFRQYHSKVVRTGPHSVYFNDPEAMKQIYGHGKGQGVFPKSKHYESFDTSDESLFSTRSKERHARKRRIVAHGFSAQAQLQSETYIDGVMANFFTAIDRQRGTAVDLYLWYEFFTMDLLSELAFGQCLNTLKAGRPHKYSKLVEESQRFSNLSTFLPFGKKSPYVLSWVPLPFIQQLWRARVEYLAFVKDVIEQRFGRDLKNRWDKKSGRQDIIQRFVEARDAETDSIMDFNELRAESASLMVAGASTGSVTMAWATYYILRHPTIKERLITELKAIDGPLTYSSLNKIKLLEGILNEVLRMHPPIGVAMPRDVPTGGAEICGIYVPGGTSVGVPAFTIGRNPEVYPNPNTWDPDRWLTADANMKTCFLGWGAGSRKCIGINLAMMFMSKLIGELFLRYDLELEDPKLQLTMQEYTIIKPAERVKVLVN